MLATLQAIYAWFQLNGAAVASAILGLLTVAETITRLTPTQSDDMFVERIGGYIHSLFDMLGVPNNAAGGGVHPAASAQPMDPTNPKDENKAA